MAMSDRASSLAEAARIPWLEPGDRLTRPEFERRYEAMPHLKKAELVEGIVYVSTRVRHTSHGQPHASVLGWLGQYRAVTAGVELAAGSTVRLDLDNEVQPDALLRLEEARGGRCRVTEDDYLEGPPELVVEVASSSASYDLHAKLGVYRRSGVQEYVVWRVLEGQIDWFLLEEGEYVRLAPDAAGLLRSRVFPGLWLAVQALLTGDQQAVLATVQEGLASPEHAAFVQQQHPADRPSP